ncbi:MAG: hypothetical protein JXR73_13950 [Candidatus Omnitrophica bacterium]|nr:hypothetical protein [Candidatus Omnitrophota bacterium]
MLIFSVFKACAFLDSDKTYKKNEFLPEAGQTGATVNAAAEISRKLTDGLFTVSSYLLVTPLIWNRQEGII